MASGYCVPAARSASAAAGWPLTCRLGYLGDYFGYLQFIVVAPVALARRTARARGRSPRHMASSGCGYVPASNSVMTFRSCGPDTTMAGCGILNRAAFTTSCPLSLAMSSACGRLHVTCDFRSRWPQRAHSSGQPGLRGCAAWQHEQLWPPRPHRARRMGITAITVRTLVPESLNASSGSRSIQPPRSATSLRNASSARLVGAELGTGRSMTATRTPARLEESEPRA